MCVWFVLEGEGHGPLTEVAYDLIHMTISMYWPYYRHRIVVDEESNIFWLERKKSDDYQMLLWEYAR